MTSVVYLHFAPVAQWIRALVFGTRCRKFESCRVYQEKTLVERQAFFLGLFDYALNFSIIKA